MMVLWCIPIIALLLSACTLGPLSDEQTTEKTSSSLSTATQSVTIKKCPVTEQIAVGDFLISNASVGTQVVWRYTMDGTIAFRIPPGMWFSGTKNRFDLYSRPDVMLGDKYGYTFSLEVLSEFEKEFELAHNLGETVEQIAIGEHITWTVRHTGRNRMEGAIPPYGSGEITRVFLLVPDKRDAYINIRVSPYVESVFTGECWRLQQCREYEDLLKFVESVEFSKP